MAFFFRNKQITSDKKKSKTNQVKLGLALGGGGARGFAHIGALKAFEEAGLEFDYVSGTSVGSLIGALYCYGLNSTQITEISHEIEARDIRGGGLLTAADPNNIGRLLKQAVGDIVFSDLYKPFYVVAVDLITASEVIIDSGSVANAVSASCAVPGVFRPVIKGNMHLVDGGVLNNIPSDLLRVRGASKVVAIDINSTRGEGTDSLNRFTIIGAAFRIMLANSAVKGLMQSDIIIRPDTKRFSASKKDGYLDMIDEGYQAASAEIDNIKALLIKE